jgi:hypothetical protein
MHGSRSKIRSKRSSQAALGGGIYFLRKRVNINGPDFLFFVTIYIDIEVKCTATLFNILISALHKALLICYNDLKISAVWVNGNYLL